MKKALLAIAIVGALALMASPASAKYWQGCGNSNDPKHPWGSLKAHNASCGKAKDVANSYSPGSASAAGFTCTVSTGGGEGESVTCHHGKKKVSFAYGF